MHPTWKAPARQVTAFRAHLQNAPHRAPNFGRGARAFYDEQTSSASLDARHPIWNSTLHMKLIESDGKRILEAAKINIPSGCVIDASAPDLSMITFPAYLKAQVLQGRRGKSGLVLRVEDEAGLPTAITSLQTATNDIPCAGFLLESAVDHESEWLVSMEIDSASGRFRIATSSDGGMSVASAQTFLVDSEDEISALDLPENVRLTLVKLFRAFIQHDALSMEINPLAIRSDKSCVALDAKIELDDAAAFRHPEWADLRIPPERAHSEREAAYAALLAQAGHRGTLGRYVELDGDIALILSGGGASLVAMDALKAAGGKAANYVEMSGNPDPVEVTKASKIVLSKPGINAIWIAGSFANFTDIQGTVNAVLAAIQDLHLHVPVVIRRDGPNADAAVADAKRWSEANNVSLRFDRADVDLDTSARAVVDAAHSA